MGLKQKKKVLDLENDFMKSTLFMYMLYCEWFISVWFFNKCLF